MKPVTLLLPLLTAQLSLASKRASSSMLTEADILNELKFNQNLLPVNGRVMLQERTKNMVLKRQSSTMVAILGSLASTINNWNKERPNAKVADVQVSNSTWPGATKKKIRYGPYRIPPTGEDNLESKLLNQKGLINTLAVNAQKPCTGNCVVFSIQPGLEYADGTVADTPNGAWLHHSVLLNLGPDVHDFTCPDGLQSYMEHVFEAGNERTVIPYGLQNSGVKSGYHIRSSDTLVINTELMNMENKEKWAWLTLTWDYVEDKPKDYLDGRIIWQSVGPNRCGGSDRNPFGLTNLTVSQQPTSMKFREFSIPWEARDEGYILGSNGHMHEGGTAIEVFQNDKQICNSVPTYAHDGSSGMSMGDKKKRAAAPIPEPQGLIGMLASYVQNAAPGWLMASINRPQKATSIQKQQAKLVPVMAPPGYMNADIEHIVEQSFCNFYNPIKLNPGDKLYIVADYDLNERKGMRNKKGEIDEVMGIAGTLMAFPYTGPGS